MDAIRLIENAILIVVAYAMSYIIVKALEPILPAFAFFVIVLYVYDFISGFVKIGMGKVSTTRAAARIFFIGFIIAIVIGVYLTFALLDIIKVVVTILLTIMLYRGMHSMFIGGGEEEEEE